MKQVVAIALVLWVLPAFGNQDVEINVNSRYTVEGVEVQAKNKSRLSPVLQADIQALVGEKLDHKLLDEIGKRIRSALRVHTVVARVARGSSPEYVRVIFEARQRPNDFDISAPKFLYHSRQGWSGVLEVTQPVNDNEFSFGILSDGDELLERFAGLKAGYRRMSLGTDNVRLGFQFESYHQQWNRATLIALEQNPDVPGIYRTRQNFEPSMTVIPAGSITWTFGASFQRFQTQFPAARTEAANAVVNSLRYHRSWEGSENQHDLDAGYSLRAATTLLDTDFVYTRHTWDAVYSFTRGRNHVLARFNAGFLSGRAPLYERFVVGNTSTLRGWNKFDLDPLGGTRLAHGTVEYGSRIFRVFSDTGSVWDRGEEVDVQHSLGLGFRKGRFMLALAFPVKDGRAEPIFMAGMNY